LIVYRNGVDLEIWAHEHSYERTWPLYDYNVYNGSVDEPYTDPGAPVHIVTGSAVSQVFSNHHLHNYLPTVKKPPPLRKLPPIFMTK